ncbi:hypothetical protein OBBRIDRAFT_834299 [Obba rivulosa]|uniref:Uncharacterized protein n=1 Tax=Obba rivulosa TaxID=1052685 RepID=A0A8E2AUN9_9APHY|nr:hypothetical protein OBBRIDRAFT_834299 [Obba rivulosa]
MDPMHQDALGSPSPHHAYAEHLFSLGFGLPLWQPYPIEPSDNLLGNVGYVRDGIFHRLFNAMLSGDRESNVATGTPSPVSPAMLPDPVGDGQEPGIGSLDPKSNVFCSSGTSFTGEISGLRIDYQLSFKSTVPSGSLLVLPGGAYRARLYPESDPGQDVARYMFEHYHAWQARALRAKDSAFAGEPLVFVTGYVRSGQWAAATFDQTDGQAHISHSMGSVTEPSSFSLDSPNGRLYHHSHLSRGTPGVQLPAGQRMLPRWTPSQDTLRPLRIEYTLFINACKIRFRSPSVTLGGNVGDGLEHADYIDILLSYILKHCDAHAAAAHDGDVYALCKTRDFPSKRQFVRLLDDVSPEIEVDEAGLAFLATRGTKSPIGIFSRLREFRTSRRKGSRQDLTHRAPSPTSPANGSWNALEVFYRGLR